MTDYKNEIINIDLWEDVLYEDDSFENCRFRGQTVKFIKFVNCNLSYCTFECKADALIFYDSRITACDINKCHFYYLATHNTYYYGTILDSVFTYVKLQGTIESLLIDKSVVDNVVTLDTYADKGYVIDIHSTDCPVFYMVERNKEDLVLTSEYKVINSVKTYRFTGG